jgi:hypothetical protein
MTRLIPFNTNSLSNKEESGRNFLQRGSPQSYFFECALVLSLARDEPKLLDQLHQALRPRHYSRRTEHTTKLKA